MRYHSSLPPPSTPMHFRLPRYYHFMSARRAPRPTNLHLLSGTLVFRLSVSQHPPPLPQPLHQTLANAIRNNIRLFTPDTRAKHTPLKPKKKAKTNSNFTHTHTHTQNSNFTPFSSQRFPSLSCLVSLLYSCFTSYCCAFTYGGFTPSPPSPIPTRTLMAWGRLRHHAIPFHNTHPFLLSCRSNGFFQCHRGKTIYNQRSTHTHTHKQSNKSTLVVAILLVPLSFA